MQMQVGLYVLGGISPSPREEMKFERQFIDPVNCNCLVHGVFGGLPSKVTRRNVMFKTFLGFKIHG